MLAAALVIAGASAAPAQNSGLEPAFSNPIVSTHPDGRQAALARDRMSINYALKPIVYEIESFAAREAGD